MERSSSLDNKNSLLLGWESLDQSRPGIGFMGESEKVSDQNGQLDYSGTGHLVTVGPTGSGKSRGSAIPALLTHEGPAIVVDVKGELYNTTSRYRRELGQRIYKIDPWSLTGEDTDSLNPLDIMELPGVDKDEEANVLAKLLAGSTHNPRDAFWENTSLALNAGLIAYLSNCVEKTECRLSRGREMLAGDFQFLLANLLDLEGMNCRLAREEFAIFLNHPERETRPCVQSCASQHFRLFGTDAIKRVMDTSSIPLQDIINAEPITIYLIIPPHKLASHGSILRLWLGVFLQVLSRRQSIGDNTTLFLVDEAASIGTMEPLKLAITLLRGYGVQVWTFWQDVSQIKTLYPEDWQTIINNAGVLQLLDPRNNRMAKEYADLIGGVYPDELLSMLVDQQLLLTDMNRKSIICRRPDYLTDSQFFGRFDSNPMFTKNSLFKIDGEDYAQSR